MARSPFVAALALAASGLLFDAPPVAAGAAGPPHVVGAQKVSPHVTAVWQGVPAVKGTRRPVTLTLRLFAARDARVSVALKPGAGLVVVAPAAPRTIDLKQGAHRDLQVVVRVTADGRWLLGAAVTNLSPDTPQVSGAVLTVIAGHGRAQFLPGQVLDQD